MTVDIYFHPYKIIEGADKKNNQKNLNIKSSSFPAIHPF